MRQLKTTKRHFLALNRERLRRLRQAVRRRQQAFLDLLPLLFHVNHPLLPGYVSEDTPAGIPDYAPNKPCLAQAEKIARSFEFKRRILPGYPIHAIFLTGSSGTVAYSAQSDFDVWVCHSPALDPAQRARLRNKANGISRWAKTLDLQTHFFLMDENSFRRKEHDQLSSESSGSAQHYLLLDEFYRTGLLVAGRHPVWWLVPPQEEHRYDEYVRDLFHRGVVSKHDVVDFGSYIHLTAEEFVGASLWQIYKGIESPYKSVLKILLMEAYASEYPEIDFLATRHKKAVYEGETDLDRLDPYMMMNQKVEEYLRGRGESSRLELVRRCFYFKVGEQLSRPCAGSTTTWRRAFMEQLTSSWAWEHAQLRTLDSRPSWGIHRVMGERKSLVDELTGSYRLLSSFVRKHADLATISEGDLNVLGRKLYAAFERKAGKIDIVNPGISLNLIERHLSIHRTQGRDGDDQWLLYQGTLGLGEASPATAVKRARSLVELLAWCHFNQLMNRTTAICLDTGGHGVAVREVRAISEHLQRVFPQGCLANVKLEELARAPSTLKTAIFVNVGIDPFERYTKQGRHIVSNRTDALSYGGVGTNLALTFDHVTLTSWQEVSTRRYLGVDGLMDCLCEFLRQSLAASRPPELSVQCFSSLNAPTIASRIATLFDDVVNVHASSADPGAVRYVLQVEHGYFVLQLRNDTPQHTHVGSFRALIQHLAAPQRRFSPIVIDRHALSDTLLPLVAESNKPGIIQLFYQGLGEVVDVYVLDENGSLFQQQLAFYTADALLNQFHLFLQSVQRRQNFLMQDSASAATEIKDVEFHEVRKNAGGEWILVRRHEPESTSDGDWFNVQVIIDAGNESTGQISAYCEEKEFSSLEHGDHLFAAVAEHIIEHREAGEHYPIYITDLDLSRSTDASENPGHIQTIDYLVFKRQIEERLNAALKGLDSSNARPALSTPAAVASNTTARQGRPAPTA